jgi:manganese/zinc/iron transport system permease protein
MSPRWILGLWPADGLRADDAWIILAASLCAVACAVTGVYLVLRRLSMLGDAISHAILPGLAGAFLLSGSRSTAAMLLGAGAVGVLTALLSSGVRKLARVQEDAALGVVFTALFALGVILISWVARDIDLDPGCVLYGLLEFTPFDTVSFAGLHAPRAVVTLAVAVLVVSALTALFFKELRIVAFDPVLAASMGIPAAAIHLGMLSLTAGVTVVAFEAVGSILVVTMLIAPAATAHLLTDRLHRMYPIAAGLGVSAAVLGYLAALRLNTSVAGMISVVAGAQFALAAVLAPRHGVLSRAARNTALSLRITREDILGLLYRWHERAAVDPAANPLRTPHVLQALHAPPLARLAIASLRRRRLIDQGPQGQLRLTDQGLDSARLIVRSHRLWELYLARHLGLPHDHLHAPSHRAEHFISPALADGLSRQLDATDDPHGRPIPSAQEPPPPPR